jgi:hypothetical protein
MVFEDGQNEPMKIDGVAAEAKRFSDGSATPLSSMAEALEELARLLKAHKEVPKEEARLRLDTFCDACSWVSVLFGCLSIAFKFAKLEYVARVVFLHRPLNLSLPIYFPSLCSFEFHI